MSHEAPRKDEVGQGQTKLDKVRQGQTKSDRVGQGRTGRYGRGRYHTLYIRAGTGDPALTNMKSLVVTTRAVYLDVMTVLMSMVTSVMFTLPSPFTSPLAALMVL